MERNPVGYICENSQRQNIEIRFIFIILLYVFYNIFVGLEDIYNSTRVGLATKIKIDKLDGKLHHDHTYYISVTAINSANLTTSRSCNITVETEAPDISRLNVNILLANPGGREVYTTENSKELGITWSGGKSDVEFYGKKIVFTITK